MPTKKPRRGVDNKGRSKKGGKFVRLGDGMLTSEAWKSLSGSAIKYYIELRRRYNGANNGDLHLSLEEARKCLRMARDTVLRVQQELVDKGFIHMTKRGGFHQRVATTWALTDEPAFATLPTHDYKNWRRKEKPSVQKLDPARSRNPTDNVVSIASSVQKLDR
jgi:hypothetical protein